MPTTSVNNGVCNPAGQPASPLVVETMAAFGIEQGDLAFLDSGAWVYASESSAVVALETSERAVVRLECADFPYLGLSRCGLRCEPGSRADRRRRCI